MKRFILGFISILGLLAVLVYIGTTQSDTSDLLLKYRRQAPFSAHEMTYHYVGKPWFGKGLIFYRPQFPTLPLKQSVERAKLILSPLEKTIYFSGISLDITETLRGNSNLLANLKSFRAPDDFLTHPLEGLALLGIDTFKGDIQLTFQEQPDFTRLTLTVFQRKHPVLEAVIPLPHSSDNRLWAWLDSPVSGGKITLFSTDLLQKIGLYYRALGQDTPPSLKRALLRQEPLLLTFALKQPQSVSALLKGPL